MSEALSPKHLKALVRIAASIRLISWVDGGVVKHIGYVSGRYTLTIEQASIQACQRAEVSEDFAKLIELSLTYAWSNVMRWAAEEEK